MTPSKTATGGFTIGYRQIGSAWQKSAADFAAWTTQNGFGFVDLGRHNVPADAAALAKAGLAAGSADLLDWNGYQAMIAPDSAERKALIEATTAHIEASAAAGAKVFFTVTVPADKAKSRKENFALMVESYSALIPALERTGTKVVIEGWPGPSAVCCTPEVYRAFFREAGSDCFGVNYDPSHLIRLGVDPMRFLKEFADRVFHVHAKDTELYPDALYECGWEYGPVFTPTHGFGSAPWRYTLPGHGVAPWIEIFRVLKAAGYRGGVSIELEDENFNGTEEGEKRGLVKSREFLEGC